MLVVDMPDKLVLVAEDHRPIATLLKRLAEHGGARAEAAEDGKRVI